MKGMWCPDILILEMRQEEGTSWGYLEEVEGSLPDTLRTGSLLMSWMTLVDQKDYILKVSDYLHVL